MRKEPLSSERRYATNAPAAVEPPELHGISLAALRQLGHGTERLWHVAAMGMGW